MVCVYVCACISFMQYIGLKIITANCTHFYDALSTQPALFTYLSKIASYMEYNGLLFTDKCFMFSIIFTCMIYIQSTTWSSSYTLNNQHKHGVKAFKMKCYSGVSKGCCFIVQAQKSKRLFGSSSVKQLTLWYEILKIQHC